MKGVRFYAQDPGTNSQSLHIITCLFWMFHTFSRSQFSGLYGVMTAQFWRCFDGLDQGSTVPSWVVHRCLQRLTKGPLLNMDTREDWGPLEFLGLKKSTYIRCVWFWIVIVCLCTALISGNFVLFRNWTFPVKVTKFWDHHMDLWILNTAQNYIK